MVLLQGVRKLSHQVSCTEIWVCDFELSLYNMKQDRGGTEILICLYQNVF